MAILCRKFIHSFSTVIHRAREIHKFVHRNSQFVPGFFTKKNGELESGGYIIRVRRK